MILKKILVILALFSLFAPVFAAENELYVEEAVAI
jgi:hypothetical protein